MSLKPLFILCFLGVGVFSQELARAQGIEPINEVEEQTEVSAEAVVIAADQVIDAEFIEAQVAESSQRVEPEPAQVNNWPPLPIWSSEELHQIRKGELELGTALFTEGPNQVSYRDLFASEDNFQPLPHSNSFPVVEEEEMPVKIAKEFAGIYFGGRPAGYLLDPQGMLSAQEYRDREGFLEYHAGASKIDLYIYVFGEKQEIPKQGQIQKIYQRYYTRGSGDTALVYYFMGAPDRSLLAMSAGVTELVGLSAIKGTLLHARQQAKLKSEPGSQLENFSTALSVRLYSIENSPEDFQQNQQEQSQASQSNEKQVVEKEKAPLGPLKIILLILMTTALLTIGLGAGWWYYQRRKSQIYDFPKELVEPSLNAPYAAGVGDLLFFNDATVSPSEQKDRASDGI